MDSSQPTRDFVTITCFVCDSRNYFKVSEAGTTAVCEMCGHELVVPDAREFVAVAKPPTPAREEYALGDIEAAPREIEVALVVCPLCGLRMHAELDQVGQRIVCPDCATETVVPAPRRQDKPALPKPIEYQISAEPLAPRPAPEKPKKLPVQTPRKPAVPRIEKPDPTRQRFLSNVFQFPWRGEVALRWFLGSLGLVVASVIGAFAYSNFDAGMFGAAGSVMLAVPALILGAIAGASVAAAFMLIVQDSGNGIDDIKDWGEADWVWSSLILLYLGGLALALGYGLGLLVAPAGIETVVAATLSIAFLLFPQFLLSALIEDRLLPPFSVAVMRSLLTHAKLWLILYGLTAIVVAPLVSAIVWAWPRAPYAAAFVAPPLLVAACFIYARLLGRLGWKIGMADEPSPRKTNRH